MPQSPDSEIGGPPPRTAPSAVEVALVHVFYAIGWLGLLWLALRLTGLGSPTSVGGLIATSAAAAAASRALLAWAAHSRGSLPEEWFASHLVWVARTFAVPFLAAALGALAFAFVTVRTPGRMALLPAVCEELAFRGFILSGLRHMGHKWTAIIISSLFFAAAHALFQQSISAFVLGLVLGFIAVQAGSLLPCILFHAVHNAMPLALHQFVLSSKPRPAWLDWLVRGGGVDEPIYPWPVLVASILAGGAILEAVCRQWPAPVKTPARTSIMNARPKPLWPNGPPKGKSVAGGSA